MSVSRIVAAWRVWSAGLGRIAASLVGCLVALGVLYASNTSIAATKSCGYAGLGLRIALAGGPNDLRPGPPLSPRLERLLPPLASMAQVTVRRRVSVAPGWAQTPRGSVP
jgi:hypothetical protein